jgi:hypothetical protein
VKTRNTTIATLVVPILLTASPAFADSGLLPGWVENVTGRCGNARALSVQVVGADVSPRVDVAPGRSTPIAVPKGLYGITVFDDGGILIEETRTLIRDGGFRILLGCGGRALDSETNVPPDPDTRLVPVRLVNSSQDCGAPETVEFRAAGRALGTVPAGGSLDAQVPARELPVDVLSGDRRVLTFHVPTVTSGQSLVYGCTHPDLFGPRNGVSVAFANTTDACEDPGQVHHLTLWIDGLPVAGLAPGRSVALRVARGKHDFQVRVGMSRERVVRGSREVTAPFRIHYGCGK